MVSLALEQLGVTAEVDIHIDKRLPVQGGLGAGSGNAVAALVGLETELQMKGPGTSDASPAVQEQVWTEKRFEIAARSAPMCRCFWSAARCSASIAARRSIPCPILSRLVRGRRAEIGVSTPQAFRDWDALCAAEGLTAEASADRLKKLSRAYASAFRGEIPEGGLESRLLRCLLRWEKTWPDRKRQRVCACPHRDHELDRERLRACCLSPASLPCRDQASSCGYRHAGGSPSCLAVGVRFGALRVVPDPRRC